MAKNDKPVFQGHHLIEQVAFKESDLLQELSKNSLFDLHGDRNMLNLPADKALALKLDVSPHNGGPLGAYSIGLNDALQELEDSPESPRLSWRPVGVSQTDMA